MRKYNTVQSLDFTFELLWCRMWQHYWKSWWESGTEHLTSGITEWRYINIICAFFCGYSWSPAGLWLSETTVCKSVQKSKFYYMHEPGNNDIKWTHLLLANDLKKHEEGHKSILRTIYYTGTCHKIAQYAAIILKIRDYKSFSKRRGLSTQTRKIFTNAWELSSFMW